MVEGAAEEGERGAGRVWVVKGGKSLVEARSYRCPLSGADRDRDTSPMNKNLPLISSVHCLLTLA